MVMQFSPRRFAGAAPLRPAPWIEAAARPVYAMLAINLAAILLLMNLTGFSYDGTLINAAVLFLIAALSFGIGLRKIGLGRLGSGVEGIALFSALSICAPLLATMLASTALPLTDTLLAHWDRLFFFGFERAALVDAIDDSPQVMAAVQAVYHSLIVQPSLLLALLFATRPERGWTLLLAWAGSLAIIVAAFPFFPAVGSPPYFLDFMGTFNGARNGTLRVLGEQALTGIITFPSFHAAAAVLLAWGYAGLGRLGPPFVVLNVLMFWSALVAGHYLIDLVAGGAIAWASIRVASRVTRARAAGSGGAFREHGQPALVDLGEAARQL